MGLWILPNDNLNNERAIVMISFHSHLIIWFYFPSSWKSSIKQKKGVFLNVNEDEATSWFSSCEIQWVNTNHFQCWCICKHLKIHKIYYQREVSDNVLCQNLEESIITVMQHWTRTGILMNDNPAIYTFIICNKEKDVVQEKTFLWTERPQIHKICIV